MRGTPRPSTRRANQGACSSHQLAQRASERLFECGFGSGRHSSVDSLLSLLPMISEVLQRREQVRPKSIGYRDGRCNTSCSGHHQLHQAIPELEHDPLRRLLSYPGDARETSDVPSLNRCDEIAGLHSGENRNRELWSDAADGNQPLEHLSLQLCRSEEHTSELHSLRNL